MTFAKVFVTGGSGFLGRTLIRHLVDTLKCEVVAIARSSEAAREIEQAGGKAVVGVDLLNIEKLREAARGCDAAVHCAADVGMWTKDESVNFAINVTGTVNVITACRDVGVKRLVHISTENVLLTGHPLVMADETVPYPPYNKHQSPYSRTKRRAEEQAVALNGNGIEVMIIRPRLIWGLGDTTILPQLAAAAKSGDLKWFSGAEYLTSTVHIKNCIAGIVCALNSGKGGEIYFLTDGEPVQVKKFFTDMLVAAGVPEVRNLWSVPTSVVWATAVVFEYVAKWTNRPPLVTRGALASLAMEITVVDAKARREIGYQNVISIDEGIEELRMAFAAQGRSVLDRVTQN